MKNNPMNIHSQEYMETMARLMSEALESPEGMQALAAAWDAAGAAARDARAAEQKWQEEHLRALLMKDSD